MNKWLSKPNFCSRGLRIGHETNLRRFALGLFPTKQFTEFEGFSLSRKTDFVGSNTTIHSIFRHQRYSGLPKYLFPFDFRLPYGKNSLLPQQVSGSFALKMVRWQGTRSSATNVSIQVVSKESRGDLLLEHVVRLSISTSMQHLIEIEHLHFDS